MKFEHCYVQLPEFLYTQLVVWEYFRQTISEITEMVGAKVLLLGGVLTKHSNDAMN